MELKASQIPGVTEHLSKEEAQALDELIPVRTFKKGSVPQEASAVANGCGFNGRTCRK